MSSTKRAAKAALRTVTSPRVLKLRVVSRLWGAALRAPGMPERVRYELSGYVARGLIRAGQPSQAVGLSAAAARRIHGRRLRAKAMVQHSVAEIALGTPSSLQAAAAAELGFADTALARGRVPAAAASLRRVARLLFDRRLHFDRLSSPLADDPASFMAPWHASKAAAALGAPRGRSATSGTLPTDRPVRLLMVAYRNRGFIESIRSHFDGRPDVDLRFLDLTDDDAHRPFLTDECAMTEDALAGGSVFGDRVRAWLGPQVEWADVVFVDWCAALAVLFTMVDPGSTRIIVRLHSFEAFALWPHMVDFSRVDDLIFVSEHLRDLVVKVVPRLVDGPATPRLRVAPNAMDLLAYDRPKPDPQARFTLGVVGIKAVAKDPLWAVEVLRHLRRVDTRYRLLLFGNEINTHVSADAAAYWDDALAQMADLEAIGAAERRGFVVDMADALTEVGVIVSSSVRESFHCGLVEGAASGAVPIVRDWPFFAGRPASARTLFPADWMADDPEKAAQRILELTSTEATWRAAGEAARRHAIDTWDWHTVQHQIDRIVLGA